VSTVRHLKPPDPAIVDGSIRDPDFTGPDDTELGTVANGAGPCRTVSANPIGDIKVCWNDTEAAAPTGYALGACALVRTSNENSGRYFQMGPRIET
jgi:hypothetical protein